LTAQELAQLLRIDAARLAHVARSIQLIVRDCPALPELHERLMLVAWECEACEVIVRAEGRRLTATGAPRPAVPPVVWTPL